MFIVCGFHESTLNCLVLGAYRTLLQAAIYDLHPNRTLNSSQNAKARFTVVRCWDGRPGSLP